jgi:hypothetical protein
MKCFGCRGGTLLGFGTEEYISVIFFGTEEYKKNKEDILFSYSVKCTTNI